MAKFLKSFFNTSEKRKLYRYEGDAEEDKADGPPLDSRRKLSISRSGRLKQANRKRHSLSLDLYGENDHTVPVHSVQKPKSVEYHVQTPVTAPADLAIDRNQRRRSADGKISQPDFVSVKSASKTEKQKSNSPDVKHRRISAGVKSPDEEIDSAFEVIDKS